MPVLSDLQDTRRLTLAPGCAISAPTLHVPWDQGYISTVYMGVMGYLGVMCARVLHIIKVLWYTLIFYVIFHLPMPLLLSKKIACFGYPLKCMAYFLYFFHCPSKAVRVWQPGLLRSQINTIFITPFISLQYNGIVKSYQFWTLKIWFHHNIFVCWRNWTTPAPMNHKV